MLNYVRTAALMICACSLVSVSYAGESFVNWEVPQVHPLDITPDGLTLLAVNTADERLEVFDISGGTPVYVTSIPVGLSPVSVRARTNGEVWVVNHISDSISIVNLNTHSVVLTRPTDDEPCDVVFAGSPIRAFVTCSQANNILVYDPLQPLTAPVELPIEGEDPRALAVSPDGLHVYAAVFESGNQSTVISNHNQGDAITDPSGPYGGLYPVPNDGLEFNPPLNPENPPQPDRVALMIRKAEDGRWMDDNNGDWSIFVDGELAAETNRVAGWDVIDNDVVIIDANTLEVTGYMTGMMNLCMAVDVHPVTGVVNVVGTEATNEIRFEPILKARFIRVRMSSGTLATPDDPTNVDLNPHLDYTDEQIALQASSETASQELRDMSIGDPRAILWAADGSQAYIAGMGSNNLIVVDPSGTRLWEPLRVGQGPTGLAMNSDGQTLYVLNKFDATISVVDTVNWVETQQVAFYDPSPEAIKNGRPFLYDTQRTSGLGQISCASCHVDGRMDQLAWDLGNPAGDMVTNDTNCGMGAQNPELCSDFHPMKGPMTTQTLQDIIGHEPLHWRADKFGLEDFNGAFQNLQGDDVQLTDEEMQLFEDFLATMFFPPNPYRNFDNSLPTSLPLTGELSLGQFDLPFGAPMPNGNAVNGLEEFRTTAFHAAGPGETATCVQCHTLPTGLGPNLMYVNDENPCQFPDTDCAHLEELPVGPFGEKHLMTTSLFDKPVKVPQLRNLYDKQGFQGPASRSRGFAFFNDGGNSLSQFLSPFAGMTSDQQMADIIAFLLAFSGGELPVGSLDTPTEPLGPQDSKDAHAAVGEQITITQGNKENAQVIATLNDMMVEADSQDYVGLVAKGVRGGVARGYTYVGAGAFQSDIAAETTTMDDLRTGTVSGEELTVTVVRIGSETRIGIDRDSDGCFDGDERLGGSDPADPDSVASSCGCDGDANGDGAVDPLDSGYVLSRFGCAVGGGDPLCDAADVNDDNVVDPLDAGYVLSRFGTCN